MSGRARPWLLAAFAGAVALPAAAHAAGPGPAGVGPALAFWAMAALCLVSAAAVAFSRNILYSSFGLLGALLGVAGLFVLLSADFLAVAQVLIYVGGVLVLVLFAVMLTSRIQDIRISNQSVGLVPAVLGAAAIGAMLVLVVLNAPWKTARAPAGLSPTAAVLGDLLLDRYLLPFEIASVVLLVTLVGAVVVARKEIKRE